MRPVPLERTTHMNGVSRQITYLLPRDTMIVLNPILIRMALTVSLTLTSQEFGPLLIYGVVGAMAALLTACTFP